MTKKKIVGFLIIACMLTTSSVMAEEYTSAPSTMPTVQDEVKSGTAVPSRAPIMKEHTENRMENKELRREKQDEIRDLKTANHQELKDLRMENKKETKDLKKEKREEVKKTMKEKKADLKNEEYQKMQARFSALTERLTLITNRIQSRIDKLTVEGKDVSNAQNLLAEAKLSIADVDVQSKVIVITPGTDEATKVANKAAIDAIKITAINAQDKLKAATDALKVK